MPVRSSGENARFKASETLLGIETQSLYCRLLSAQGFKASETLLGIETQLGDSGGIETSGIQSL